MSKVDLHIDLSGLVLHTESEVVFVVGLNPRSASLALRSEARSVRGRAQSSPSERPTASFSGLEAKAGVVGPGGSGLGRSGVGR
jgi:hypothetical protein